VQQSHSKKHIAILFWDWKIGGAQTRYQQIISSLVRKKQVNCVALFLHSKVTERQLPSHRKLKVISFDDQGKQSVFRKNFLGWLFFQLITSQPTHIVVITHRFALVGLLAKLVLKLKRRSVKLIVNQVVLTSAYIDHHEKKYWQYLAGVAYYFADLIIVPTQAVKLDLMSRFLTRPDKIKVIPSWVQEKKKVKSKKKKLYDLIFIGRLVEEKNIDELVNLFKKFKQKKLPYTGLILGDGPLRQQLIFQIKKYRLNSRLKLVRFSNQVTNYLAQSKVLFLPSRYEGLPMVVLEAGQLGVPSIVSNFKGADEVVANGLTGEVCKNSKDFVTKTVTLLESGSRQKYYSLNVIKWVKNNYSLINLNNFVSRILK
jgi:glycosyltransferase involved in cell wall biosynthesis